MSVAIAIILDTRRKKEITNTHIKLRVSFKRVTSYYQSIFDLSQKDYDKLLAPRIAAGLPFGYTTFFSIAAGESSNNSNSDECLSITSLTMNKRDN
jgi:hypothetical protein